MVGLFFIVRRETNAEGAPLQHAMIYLLSFDLPQIADTEEISGHSPCSHEVKQVEQK